jgi:hypothetical protein
MRKRLAMIVGILALGASLGALGTAAPASADLAPAQFWCTAYKPHTGDSVTYAQWIFLNQFEADARCKAHHLEQGIFGPFWVEHCYYVTVFADGSSSWSPYTCPAS